jgi:superfamily II DNA or RNA helicase
MTFSPNEQQLIDTLKALPPNSIYRHAEKRTIMKGFQLYTSHQVSDIGWEENGTLSVVFALQPTDRDSSTPHVVHSSIDQGSLTLECSCSAGGGQGKCEHTVAVLMTILNLLNPRLFNMTRDDPHLRAHLEEGLFKEKIRAPEGDYRTSALNLRDIVSLRRVSRYQVIVETTGGRVTAFVESNGERVTERDDFRRMPWEIAYLARCSYQKDMSFVLPIFLKKADNLYPLFYQRNGRRQRIEWQGEKVFRTWTELDANGSEVRLRKGFSLNGEGPEFTHLVGNMAFTEDRRAMCSVAGRDGWLPWDELARACFPDHVNRADRDDGLTVGIPLDVFKKAQIVMKKGEAKELLEPIRCLEGGKESAYSAVEASSFRLVISRAREKEDVFTVEPQCLSGDYVCKPSQQVFSFARDVEWGRVPASLRTKKRKAILYDAFFHTLSENSRKGMSTRLKEEINEQTFGKSHLVAEARRMIKSAVDRFKDEDAQFHITPQGWRLITVDKSRETLLFVVPYAIFGSAIFERLIRDGSLMVVREEHLFQELYLLEEVARESGIELFFGDRPVESVTWELTLDATSGTIDWFEIRPEIRSKGNPIPRELWEQALARKGVVIRNGSIQVLSRKSMEALDALYGLWGKTKAERGRTVVSIPRLRMIELFALKKKGIAVRLSPEDGAVMEHLLHMTEIEKREVPAGFRGNLRPYQRKGYEWLAFLFENRFGACLADDMGLGKTIQAIALMAGIREERVKRSGESGCPSAPFLVVLPPSLIFNWEQEIEKFYPSFRVCVYRGKMRSADLSSYDVILTSYGLVRRDIGRLREIRFGLIIFDEAQAIKNIFAGTTSAVRQLQADFKVALTGTPVENHVGEFFSIVDLVLPGLLGDYKEFRGQTRNDLSSALPVIGERTKPFILRRTKEHILSELPPKVERDIYLDLTEQQKRFYNQTVSEVRSTIESAYRSNTASQAKIIALTAIMRLRQICLTPELLVADTKESSPKVEFLKEKVAELLSESHSALVFSQFTSFLDIVGKEMQADGFPLFRLDGSTPVSKRKEIVESFQNSHGPSIFLLSLKAGGQGLNLTRATYVFHLDPWWNPAVENQASDRAHRIGQTNKVMVTRLLMRHTVEEKMMALKHRKQALYKALMETPEKGVAGEISREDFAFLLS